jgi:hypothetical protein
MRNTTTLKFRYLYAKSSTPRSWRPHLVDLDFSKVTWYDDDPSATKYQVRWYCGLFSDKAHPIFMRDLPEGVELCRGCVTSARIRAGLEIPGYRMVKRSMPFRPVVHPSLAEEVAIGTRHFVPLVEYPVVSYDEPPVEGSQGEAPF